MSSDLTLTPEYPLGPPLLGALLRVPTEAVAARILLTLHDAGFTDLVPAHFAVLRYPGPENRRPSELAAEAHMTKQAMNYLLGQMQQLGYLTRDDDPEDQRYKRVRLTERGHAAALAIRETLSQILEFEGYDVTIAADGAEALAAVDAQMPCLVLLDMRMPVMDGWGFAAALRERGVRVPIAVMTAAANAQQWADEIAADACLPKPFDLLDISAVVARFCGDPA